MEKHISGLLERFPDKVPVIVIDNKNILNKKNFIVPRSSSLCELLIEIRKRSNLKPSESFFLFVNNYLPTTSSNIGILYDKYKRGDCTLYFTIEKENSFG